MVKMISDPNEERLVTLLAAECPDALYQTFGAYQSLAAAEAKSDLMIEDGTWPEGAILCAVGFEDFFEFAEDEGWFIPTFDNDHVATMIQEFKPRTN